MKDGDESEPKKGVADSQQNRDFVLEHKLEVSYIWYELQGGWLVDWLVGYQVGQLVGWWMRKSQLILFSQTFENFEFLKVLGKGTFGKVGEDLFLSSLIFSLHLSPVPKFSPLGDSM